MSLCVNRFIVAALIFAGLSGSVVVEAQSVIVLGLRSAEGDDEFASNLSGALRNASGRVTGWELHAREVSLAQMTLAHGCDGADVSCMEAIGNTLGVQYIIYGNVRRTSTRSNYDFALNLFFFDASEGSITNQLTDTIPKVQSDIDDLRNRARRYIAQFSGAEQTGRIVVQANVAAAEVFIDGESVGTTTAGAFEAVVPVGAHQVEVRAEGHATFRGTVTVVADGAASLEVELIEGDENQIIVEGGGELEVRDPDAGGGPNWGAISLLSLAGASAVMGVVSMVQVNSINSDLEPWRQYVGDNVPSPEGGKSACDYLYEWEADPDSGPDRGVGNGPSLCTQGSTWYALQFVFWGVAGAAALGGVLFLVLGGDDEEESADSSTLSIIPAFSPTGGNVTATLTF